MKTRTRTGVPLALAATVLLLACSSGGGGSAPRQDAPAPNIDADAADPIRSNTGLPGGTRLGIKVSARRPATIDLDYLDGENGYGLRLETDTDGAELPWAFHALGDVDGDGLGDFAIVTSLRSYLVRGDGSRPSATPDLASFVAERGTVLERRLELVGVGDLDGDGLADLAWPTLEAGSSAVRVVFGRADGDLASLTSRPIDGRAGLALVNSDRPRDLRSVAAAGDVDGDGIDDLLIGAFAYNGEDYDAPNAWVVYGDRNGFPAVLDLARLAPRQGLALTSPLDETQRAAVDDDIGSGYDARIAGGFDFDGDGLDDVAIGASAFDWIGREGELRSYVVFGRASRDASTLDMTALDGSDGLVIIREAPPAEAQVDEVVALGDVDGDGRDDLAVFDSINAAGEAHVIRGGAERFGPRLERSALPAGAGFAVVDSDAGQALRGLARVGDLDDDGLDDIGVEYEERAAVLYDDVGTTTRVDLAAPGTADLGVLLGGGGGELVALGDVDVDGVDDLGIGWSRRRYDPGVRDAGDIDGDGVDDVEIAGSGLAELGLIRVLYGFGPGGFVGVLPDPDGPRPLQRVDESLYAGLLAAIEHAAQAPLDHLGATLASGAALGPIKRDCLEGFDGGRVTRLVCPENPLPFAFDWAGPRLSFGTAGGLYARVERDAEGLRAIDYRSLPPSDPTSGFVGPFDARFSFERRGELTLFGNTNVTPPDATVDLRCSIDTNTRLASGDAALCAALIERHVRVLDAIFGPGSEVGALRFGVEP